jgi:two-component system CheB/CheR fusion protein
LTRFFLKEHRGYRVRRELRELVLFANHDVLRDSPFSRLDLVTCRNLLHAVSPSVRLELRGALYQAAQTGQPVELVPLPLEVSGGTAPTTVRVVPMHQGSELLFVVTFDATAGQPPIADSLPAPQADALASHLDREIERLKHSLRETVEQYEASTEELKASNEELQAMNEELRAATEELETSREELQSINEELTTVNQELKSKVDQLSHANSDMHNLMDATAIATVFLDRELRVKRYTPSAVSLFNLSPTDLGRPLSDMATQLDYPELGNDARRVLERLIPIEREVGQSDGSWYLARLMPYRTLDDRIAGLVFTFIDITERKQAEEMRRWLAAVVGSTSDAIVSFALDRTVLSWNGGAERIFGYTAQQAIGQPMDAVVPGNDAEQQHAVDEIAAGRAVENVQTVRRRRDGSDIHVAMTVSPIRDGSGHVLAGTAVLRDISAAREAAEALRQSEERLRLVLENAVEYAIFSTDLDRNITTWNTGAQRLLGFAEDEAVGRSADMIFTEEDRAAGAPQKEAGTARREGRAADERYHRRKDGSRFRGSGVMMLMRNEAGQAVGFLKIMRDRSRPEPQPEA